MRTTLLFSSLAQKRAGVGVGFRSVLMSAMTDLNICTHKLPKNFPCLRLQEKPRGPPLPKRAYEISNLPKDFKISVKISDFARISAEISRFHVISGEISRFQQRFHGSQRTAYSQGTLRGAGASATECDTASARVCIREYAGTSL